MEEQDCDLDFEELGSERTAQADTATFYRALKTALERTPVEAAAAAGG